MSKSTDSADKSNFDLERFRKLLQLMEKYDVTAVNLNKEGESWKVRRGPKHVTVAPGNYPVPQQMQAAPAAAPTTPPAGPTPAEPPQAAAKGITIDAPAVGTYYSSPTPEDPVFVSVGSRVQPDTIVCIIEAMKVFNQIPAEKSGKIVEILVENGDPVEFGQPLFRIEP